MSNQEKFTGFVYQDNNPYKTAAINKYGKEVVEQANEKQKGKYINFSLLSALGS